MICFDPTTVPALRGSLAEDLHFAHELGQFICYDCDAAPYMCSLSSV